MRLRAPVASWLLLSLLVGSPASPAASATEKEFRGKRITLGEAPHSQLAVGHPVHPVGTELRVGGASFPIAQEKGKLRVAPAPGGEPSVDVAAGKPVPLSWIEGDEKRAIQITFSKDEAGAWSCWASQAVEFQVAGEKFRLFDSDADGRFGDLKKDGWSMGETDQVVPLAGEILLGPTLVSIRSIDPDGGRIVAEAAPLQGTKSQIAAIVLLNRLRAANGLPPAVLDRELSASCTAHALYLAANGWSGNTNPHTQNLGPKGASPDGAAAAARSAIGTAPPDASVEGFWRTYYHRMGLMGPALDRVGVNAEPQRLAVVDAARGYGEGVGVPGVGETREQKGGPWPWTDPVFVPADGSAGFPTSACAESPKEPVANLGSRGTPLMALFRATSRATEFSGTLEESRGGGWVKVPCLAADPGEYPFALGIVPEKPLRGHAAYRATFSWKAGGREVRRTIRFRTE